MDAELLTEALGVPEVPLGTVASSCSDTSQGGLGADVLAPAAGGTFGACRAHGPAGCHFYSIQFSIPARWTDTSRVVGGSVQRPTTLSTGIRLTPSALKVLVAAFNESVLADPLTWNKHRLWTGSELTPLWSWQRGVVVSRITLTPGSWVGCIW